MGKKYDKKRIASNKKSSSGRNNNDGPTHFRNKKGKLEIRFDPSKRREYLTGFSKRKQERRAFGLAMQKVKDRKAKLEDRKATREAKEEQLLELEAQKKRIENDGVEEGEDDDDDDDDDSEDGSEDNEENDETTEEKSDNSKCLVDTLTTHDVDQFGENVTVTTTFGLPEDDDEKAEELVYNERSEKSLQMKKGSKYRNNDEEQRMAGNVNHFIKEVKRSGVLSSKSSRKNQGNGSRRKGNHGAAQMKGIGGSANLKIAKKSLSIAKAKLAKKSKR